MSGDLRAVSRVLRQQGVAALGERDHQLARALMEESVSLARREGDRWGLAIALGQLGSIYRDERDYATARPLYEEAVDIAREIGDRYALGIALAGLAFIARARGDRAESEALWRETLVVSSEVEDEWILPRAIAGLAGAAVLAGDHGRAARLFGAEAGLREASGSREFPFWRAIMEMDATTARAASGDRAFAAAWAEGRAMTLEQAVAYGLSVAGPTMSARPPDHRVGAQASPLSPREAEVAALIAQGLTNHQIGSTLVISERTVDAHVRHILDKLGFTSRAHVAAWAVRQGLVDDGAPRPDR
jgi:non-specific serine/threonine protein kinase